MSQRCKTQTLFGTQEKALYHFDMPHIQMLQTNGKALAGYEPEA
jgi:hypothetical protein